MFFRLDVDCTGRFRPGSPVIQDLLYSNHHVAIREPTASCKPWPRNLHCRRRLHKSFLQWYAANEYKFAIKLELLKRTDAVLSIGFCGISRAVTASLAYDEMNVALEWQGTYWDSLLSLDTIPKSVPGGYVCDLCPEDDRPVFSSPEAIWRAEIFEPFLEWVNHDLTKAEAVSISGTPDWVGWARLVV